MIIKNAEWEKQNLGVSCTEYFFDSSDTVENALNAVKDNNSSYQVAKVECGNIEILRLLERQGFGFVETNIQLEKKIESRPIVPSMFSRLMKDVVIEKASPSETELILEKIESGAVFTTDKVALDPLFGPKMAGRRYSLWSKSLLNENCYFVVAKMNSGIISFSLGVRKGDYFDAFLGGLFDANYRSFGFLPIYCNMLSAFENGSKVIKTGVSSNNLPILKLHIAYGFKITNLYYVLIKHTKNN